MHSPTSIEKSAASRPLFAVNRKLIATVLFMLAILGGLNAATSWRLQMIDIYQNAAPSIALACMGKLRDMPMRSRSQAIQDFLALKRMTLECSDLTTDGTKIELAPLSKSPSHQIEGFLVAFGWLWKIFGISWKLSVIFAAAFGAMLSLSIFALSRTLLGPIEALATTAFIVILEALDFSSYTSVFAPWLRDYSKAPFMILLIALAIMGAEARGRQLPMLATLSGLATGIGLGFRSDMTLFIVLFPIVYAVKLVLQSDRRYSALAIVCFGGALWAVDLFIFNFSAGLGTFFFHWYMLGQSGVFMRKLAIVPGSYFFNPVYDDGFVAQIVALIAAARGLPLPTYGTHAYDDIGFYFFQKQLSNFPADNLLEAYSASMMALFGDRQWIVLVAMLYLLCPIVLLYFYGRRAYVPVIVIYGLAATTFIQFDLRHYFFYRYAGLLLLCACFFRLAEVALRPLWRWTPRLLDRTIGVPVVGGPAYKLSDLYACELSRGVQAFGGRLWKPKNLWHAGAPVGAFALFLAMMVVGRIYQAKTFPSIITGLNSLPGKQLTIRRFDIDGGTLATITDPLAERSYVRISIATDKAECTRNLRVTLAYSDYFTHELPAPPDTAHIYTAIIWFTKRYPHFLGFRVGRSLGQCISAVELIDLAGLNGRVLPLIYFDSPKPEYRAIPYRLAINGKLL